MAETTRVGRCVEGLINQVLQDIIIIFQVNGISNKASDVTVVSSYCSIISDNSIIYIYFRWGRVASSVWSRCAFLPGTGV